ncbi:hypothetical protein FHS89_001800 [Rubricella aquisinus]|uniref:Prophage minor tail protein Z (GPZ) n=1 Tax=Rubricella aquisinus TaxID=2028108 RepID=A0A840WX74_9RHOB|nr:phage tail protein [Rubricella aquisinus]MBB5515780.1 hypothetical protein [Rubricella aquisinus]
MLKIGDVDVKNLARFENMLGALGTDAPKAMNSAINRTGSMARTQVIRSLSKQTGLPQKTIRKAIKVKRSSWDDLRYSLSASGGDVSLKYFKPHETRKGVTAFVRGQRQLYENSFMKGGSFSRGRVALNMGGHVFQRIGPERLGIEKLKSGVVIPAEMVDGASAAVFEETVTEHLPRRLDHEIGRLLGL